MTDRVCDWCRNTGWFRRGVFYAVACPACGPNPVVKPLWHEPRAEPGEARRGGSFFGVYADADDTGRA